MRTHHSEIGDMLPKLETETYLTRLAEDSANRNVRFTRKTWYLISKNVALFNIKFRG